MSAQAGSKTSILVVEDNVDTQILLRYFLQSSYQIALACKVDEAIQLTAHTTYSLLLMDIHLGEERTGIDLLHLLRQQPEYAKVPIIALTAYAMPGDRNRFINMGFDGYVSKPFTQKQLLDTINQVLAG
ncbi:MAG: response regulator [Rhodothermales bacterium]